MQDSKTTPRKIKLSPKSIDRSMTKATWKAMDSWLRNAARKLEEEMERRDGI